MSDKANLKKRNQYRNTVCVGCRHNYYNYAKFQSPRGDVAVPEKYHCWYIPDVKNGKCRMYSK